MEDVRITIQSQDTGLSFRIEGFVYDIAKLPNGETAFDADGKEVRTRRPNTVSITLADFGDDAEAYRQAVKAACERHFDGDLAELISSAIVSQDQLKLLQGHVRHLQSLVTQPTTIELEREE